MDTQLERSNSLNKIEADLFTKAGVTVYVKRDDLVHPIYGGNKFRKLKYTIEHIKQQGIKTVLTFGGSYSNHIAATAFAGRQYGFATIGIIRGDELGITPDSSIQNNKTLREASQNDMQFKFVSRADYKRKYDSTYWDELQNEFGNVLIVPEGGSNELALKGCAEAVSEIDIHFNYLVTAVGTGTTLLGVAGPLKPHQVAVGIEVYKNKFTSVEQLEFLKHHTVALPLDNIVLKNYAFDGYGKSNLELTAFCETFTNEFQIPIEPIYTGKMFFGLFDLIRKGFFKRGSVIIALHTGGLQYI